MWGGLPIGILLEPRKLPHYFDPNKATNNNRMLLLNIEPVKVTMMSAY